MREEGSPRTKDSGVPVSTSGEGETQEPGSELALKGEGAGAPACRGEGKS